MKRDVKIVQLCLAVSYGNKSNPIILFAWVSILHRCVLHRGWFYTLGSWITICSSQFVVFFPNNMSFYPRDFPRVPLLSSFFIFLSLSLSWLLTGSIYSWYLQNQFQIVLIVGPAWRIKIYLLGKQNLQILLIIDQNCCRIFDVKMRQHLMDV